MTTALRVAMYVLAGIGWLFMLCGLAVFVGRFIAAGNRRAPQYVVRWRNRGEMECGYYGTVTDLGSSHIVVEGNEGPIVIAKADIIEVL